MLDISLLEQHIVNSVVSKMHHPEFPELVIYNYTHVAQHDNIWDNVTEQTRGLIVNKITNDVLARPFRKFFNLNTSFRSETQEANLPAVAPTVLEKLDGSLGILYYYDGKSSIATRGSFTSDQAKWANKWYNQHCSKIWFDSAKANQPKEIQWPEGYTPLFEIIYKENRIVVDYGSYEGLVLLGLVNIETGFELPYSDIVNYGRNNGFRVAERYPMFDLEKCKSFAETNREGFVLQYWPNKAPVPLRLKVKTVEYTRLHKIITGMNPKGIWEHLSGGYDSNAIWANTTPQFTDWAIGWIRTFENLYKELERNAFLAFGEICAQILQLPTYAQLDARALRKHYAMAIQERPYQLQGILFTMLSGKGFRKEIWKNLEPKIQGKDVFIRDVDSFNGV